MSFKHPAVRVDQAAEHQPPIASPLPVGGRSSSGRLNSNMTSKYRSNDAAESAPSSSFFVMIAGDVESANFPSGIDDLYCRYSFSYGPDWEVVHGINMGLSQIGRRRPLSPSTAPYSHCMEEAPCQNPGVIVWNFPLEISFKSTNAFGWPRVAISVYGLDFLGRDVVRGYGSLVFPTSPGHYVRYVKTYRPVSGSLCQQIVNWLAGTPPEYFDSRTVNLGEGRAVTRVYCEGVVKVTFTVTTKEMSAFGYSV